MTITFEEKVELIGKYKDKNEKFELVYKYGKNIDSPKLNDEQKEKARKNVEVAYNAIKQIEDNKAKKTATAKSGAKKKTMLGLASEIKKRDNVTWAEAKKRAKSEYESDKKKAVSEEKQQIADFKKQVGKIKFTRATTKTDIKKDKVLPALPSGKRYPKRGTTTNKYGTYKNDPKKPYWENRANRMDVNQPSKSVYPKLADGGVIGSGKNGFIAFYKGKRVEVMADTKYQAQQTAAKYFKAKKEWEVNVKLAEVDGKPYIQSTAFAKGGEVKLDNRFEFIKEIGEYKIYYNKSAKNYAIVWKSRFAPAFETMEDVENYISKKKMEFAKGGEIAKGNYEMMLSQAKEVQHHTKELQNILKGEKDIDAWVVAKMENVSSTLSDITHYLDGKTEYAQGGTTKRIKRMGC